MPHRRTYGGQPAALPAPLLGPLDEILWDACLTPSERVARKWRKHAGSDLDERRRITRHVHLRKVRGTERPDFYRLLQDRIAETVRFMARPQDAGTCVPTRFYVTGLQPDAVITDEVHDWTDGYQRFTEGRGE